MINNQELQKLLQTTIQLNNLKKSEIVKSKPILEMEGIPLFYPNTINLIQGQTGTHKSRLAQHFCSSLISKEKSCCDLLNLKNLNSGSDHKVIYVDTERNITEQFPQALQEIQLNAGYKINDNVDNLIPVSLLQVNRISRFKLLTDFLNHIKNTTSGPYFIVLDVSTDCIVDFNDPIESMKLIDLMNRAVNDYSVIFLCIIHENPGSGKARGHIGTELKNKVTTAIKVDITGETITLRFIKCRNDKVPNPISLRFDESSRRLIRVSNSVKQKEIIPKRKVAHDEEIESILKNLKDSPLMSHTDLINLFLTKIPGSKRTFIKRINEYHYNRKVLKINSERYFLNKKSEGVKELYFLQNFN